MRQRSRCSASAGAPEVRIESPRFSPRRVRIGEALRFSFELVNAGRSGSRP